MDDVEASVATTPTWAIAGVCSALVVIALLLEHCLHLLTAYVRRRKRRTLDQALDRIKAELRNLGFMSLLLTIGRQPISRINISRSWGNSFLPCNDAGSVEEEEGKVPLVSDEGTTQLQMLMFVLAIFHVLSCLLTLGLGEAKIKRWKSWEEETRTLEHQLSNDPRRFKLTQQTSFGRRHLKIWSDHSLLLWLVCFVRQFTDSVSKADYFTLRQGFITVHFGKDYKFDFHKFLRRSLDQDFVLVVTISIWIWIYGLFFIFFNAHEFYNHFWLPFVPLVLLLVIGTKLEVIITTMCRKSTHQAVIVPGMVPVKPGNSFFWFGRPRFLLHFIQFIIIQNSFQLAFFTWTLYKFGFRSCFYRETTDIVLSIGVGVLVQFMCAYVTLPLYTLVTQMGSSMETVLTDRVIKGLKNWRRAAKKNRYRRISTPSSPSTTPSASPRIEVLSPNMCLPSMPKFEYPSGRTELLAVQRVVEEIIESSANNAPKNGDFSFSLWRKHDSEITKGVGG